MLVQVEAVNCIPGEVCDCYRRNIRACGNLEAYRRNIADDDPDFMGLDKGNFLSHEIGEIGMQLLTCTKRSLEIHLQAIGLNNTNVYRTIRMRNLRMRIVEQPVWRCAADMNAQIRASLF